MLVHTIWIQDASSSRTFGMGEWLSICSLLRNTPYSVILHTNLKSGKSDYDPFRIIHDRFVINYREFDLKWHGVRMRPANLSDIERIRLLYEHGGIYSDLDIWWLKPLDAPTTHPILIAYENPSYKTITNAFIMAHEAGNPVLLEVLHQMEGRFINLASRGILDLTANPTVGLSPYHTLLWKLTGDIMKQNGALIIGKSHFYKNGWRRIGRDLRRHGIALNPVVDASLLGNTLDKVGLVDTCGFHYFAGLYTADQVMCLPVVRETFTPILTWSHQWLC